LDEERFYRMLTFFSFVHRYKDRQRIESDKHYEVRCENNLCLLLINTTDYDDTGAYMCRAVNDAGSATTEARVRVQSE
jgi:hypothetical protein